jgi:hypothetical protein
LLVFFCPWSGYSSAYADIKPVSKGELFPNIIFTDALTKEARLYLEIPQKKKFTLKDMKGTLFIFEVFSTYCMSCPKNVPFFNSVYNLSQNDTALKGKVKVIGIAVGNTFDEAKKFGNELKVSYPILTDYSFTAHKAMGNVRVPFTVFVKRNAKGKGEIVATHQGVYDSSEDVMKIVQDALRENLMRENRAK